MIEIPEPPAELTEIAKEVSRYTGIPITEVANSMMKVWKHFAEADPLRLNMEEERCVNRVKSDILEKVGEPAALEQLAEECGELAMAALNLGHVAQKLARIKRNENPTPRTSDECIEEFHEEVADVEVSIDVMMSSPWMHLDRINHYYDAHMKRWRERLGIEKTADDKTD